MALFVIVGKNEPIYETDFSTPASSTTTSTTPAAKVTHPPTHPPTQSTSFPNPHQTYPFIHPQSNEDSAYLNQFIVHSSLDMLEKAMWASPAMQLRAIDRFNGQVGKRRGGRGGVGEGEGGGSCLLCNLSLSLLWVWSKAATHRGIITSLSLLLLPYQTSNLASRFPTQTTHPPTPTPKSGRPRVLDCRGHRLPPPPRRQPRGRLPPVLLP